MMMLEFFRFELRQQLRAPLLWLVAGLFGLFAFAAAGSDAVQIGGSIGNVNRNAPTVVAFMLGFFTILGLFVAVTGVSGSGNIENIGQKRENPERYLSGLCVN